MKSYTVAPPMKCPRQPHLISSSLPDPETLQVVPPCQQLLRPGPATAPQEKEGFLPMPGPCTTTKLRPHLSVSTPVIMDGTEDFVTICYVAETLVQTQL